MRRASGGIGALMMLRVARLLEQRGVAPEPLLAHAGLSLRELEEPRVRVSYPAVDQVLTASAEQLGAAGLGLALARTQIHEAYGAAGLLLITSPNLREGLTRALLYQRLWGDGERFRLYAEGRHTALRFRHPGASATARAILSECALAEVMEGARQLVSSDARPLSVAFEHAPLGDSTELEAYFGVAPGFGSAENSIVLAQELVEKPLSLPRELLRSAIEEQCRRALNALPERWSVAMRVRTLLLPALETPPSLQEIAEKLRMSARTLQRKLHADGTSFQELLDRERRAQSEELAKLGRPLKEAALRVGFADPSALSRARRRWSGRG